MRRFNPIIKLTLVFTCLITGCSDESSTVLASDSDTGDTLTADVQSDTASIVNWNTGTPIDHLPSFAELDDQWNILQPGGETTCAHEDPFLFYVYKGTENKVILDFLGGGACWNQETCEFGDALCQKSSAAALGVAADPPGFYDKDRDDNPLRDWHHVVVPYCTCDVHWGNAVGSYGEGDDAFEIQHKGSINAHAVMDWVFTRLDAPERILVTGCSAGAYGSIYYTPWVVERYPDTPIIQFGDSGAGIITEDFFAASFPIWNAFEAAPDWIPNLNPNKVDFAAQDMPYLYIEAAAYYPDVRFSQYHTLFDNNQLLYFQAMGGGDAETWSEKMMADIQTVEAEANNFHAYIADGEQHCILTRNQFYEREANGVLFTDWLSTLVSDEPAGSVYCDNCVP